MQSTPCGLKRCGEHEYYCSIELTIQLIGGKWKPIILWHLAQDGILRFGELRRIIPNITQKMLTQQLRELEADGLVHREVYPQVPPKVEYSLTKPGKDMMPLLIQMRDWGAEYAARFGKQETSEDAA